MNGDFGGYKILDLVRVGRSAVGVSTIDLFRGPGTMKRCRPRSKEPEIAGVKTAVP